MTKLTTGNHRRRYTRYCYAIWFAIALALSGCDGGIFGTGDGEDIIGVETPGAPVDGGGPTTEPTPTPEPSPTPEPTPDPVDPEDPPATTPPGTETADVVFINNESETDRSDALLRMVMANAGLQDNIVVTINDEIDEPLVSLPGLSFLDGATSYRAVPAADDHNVAVFRAEDIREGDATPLISINPLDVSAGSVTTLVIRGGATSSAVSVDVLPAITKSESDNSDSQVRLLHAAFGYATNGALDIHLVPAADDIDDAIFTITNLSYSESPLTDYTDVPSGQYELIVTPTGLLEPEVRIDQQITLTSDQVITIVLRDDAEMMPGESITLLSVEDSDLLIE